MSSEVGFGNSGPLGFQVTSANFELTLPLIREALDECTFWAFDTEFTGLSLSGQPTDSLDSLEERYEKNAHGPFVCVWCAHPLNWLRTVFFANYYISGSMSRDAVSLFHEPALLQRTASGGGSSNRAIYSNTAATQVYFDKRSCVQVPKIS
eukprot:1187873-Prorocentrum_minimum.AAC.1